jgi:hypothetical protein
LTDLSRYLGFAVKNDAEVPQSTGKAKVVRKKAFGDWRNWFTPEDEDIFKPAYQSYMQTIGYDVDDWSVSPDPVIEPQFSSLYMKRLVRENTTNPFRRLMGKLSGAL